MRKLLIILLIILPLTASAFFCPTETVEKAISTGDFENLIVNYFLPSLSPREMLVFGAELNISNGRLIHENGERYMFGQLESAGSMLRYLNPEIVYERVRDEVARLLFGPWVKPGNTTFKLLRRAGKALDLQTGVWRPYSGQAIIIHHTTEYFGGQRARILTFNYDGFDCKMTILKVK